MGPEAWTRAAKDFLSWSSPMLPLKLGLVPIGAAVLFALYKFTQLFVGRGK